MQIQHKSKYKGNLIIISSPSGAGKTSITKAILEFYSNLLLSVSVTTRNKRENEIEAKDYFFISKEEFNNLVESDNLLEHAKVFENYYGTPKKFVTGELEKGNNVIFDIDWQGARQILKHKEFNIITIFILPPSIEILRSRLTNRGLDSDNVIEKRMLQAKEEISHYEEYDYVILNDDFESAVSKIKKIIDFHNLTSIKPEAFKEFVTHNLK